MDNTSKYDKSHTGYSFAFDTDHYLLTGASSIGRFVIIPNSVGNQVKITCMMKNDASSNRNNVQPAIGFRNITTGDIVHSRFTSNYNEHIMAITNGTIYNGFGSNVTQANYTYSRATWYICELILDGTSITFNMYNESNTLLKSISGTTSTLGSVNEVLIGGVVSMGNIQFKDLIIEPL